MNSRPSRSRTKIRNQFPELVQANDNPVSWVPEDVKKEIINYLKVKKLQKDLAQQQFEDMVELGSYHGKNDKADDSRRAIRGPMDRFVTNIDGNEEPNTKMTGAKLRNNALFEIIHRSSIFSLHRFTQVPGQAPEDVHGLPKHRPPDAQFKR
ncbi:Uncharacterized protein Fot_08386 [Forsythia ovata]|uniref:Uncharacterized protein n=1 Tax=Forsythia ovata TaxID=205694 RepID=A0ABD1WYJ1_9LAMI